MKFCSILQAFSVKINNIYSAGKCPGRPFLNFLDPPWSSGSIVANTCYRFCNLYLLYQKGKVGLVGGGGGNKMPRAKGKAFPS